MGAICDNDLALPRPGGQDRGTKHHAWFHCTAPAGKDPMIILARTGCLVLFLGGSSWLAYDGSRTDAVRFLRACFRIPRLDPRAKAFARAVLRKAAAMAAHRPRTAT